MIDHLLRFDDETAAREALPQFWAAGDRKSDSGSWDTSRCIPDVKVYRVASVDEKGIETRDYVAGWFIQIGLVAEDPTLNKRAAATIIDRQTKVRTKVDAAVAAKTGWKTEPVFAGS